MRVEFRGHASIHEEIMRGCGNERPPSIFNLSTDDRKRPQRARHIVTPKRTRFELFLSLSLSLLSRKFLRVRIVSKLGFDSCYEILKSEKLYNEKLKSEKLINEKFVVVEREYRGLEIESEERACIYIYVYIICLLDVRFIRDSRYRMEKSEEYGRENGPDRKEMNCQHCLLI